MGKAIKWIVLALVLGFVGKVLYEARKASIEVDGRIALTDACVRQAKKLDALPAAKVDAVCTCTIERTAKALGPDKFIRLARVTTATDADRSALAASLNACVAELAPPG